MGEPSSTAHVEAGSPADPGPLANPRFRARGSLDYLLRTTQQAQIRHSGMADSKANIMITVSSVVFSITINQIGNQDYQWPLLTLCGFSMGSLIAAIFTVMPSGTQPSKAPKPGSPHFNLLFFGHFSRLSQEDFIEELSKAARTDDSLYETICRDIYGAGTVLAHKKYLPLRISYTCFLLGVVVAAAELLFKIAA